MSDFVDTETVRIIEEGVNPERYARGWHCLGRERDFVDGEPRRLDAFGTSLVVSADAAGSFEVLDAYGGHAPKPWTSMRRNGLLFVWNDPQGSTPTDAVTIPVLSEYGSPEWTDWSWNSTLVQGSHCREMVDNVVDMAHFFYVHYAMPSYFKNVFEGHTATQYMSGGGRQDVHIGTAYDNADGELESWATYFGPSFMINGQTLTVDGFQTEGLLINCHYPIGPDSFLLQYGAIVKKNSALSEEESQAAADAFTASLETAFEQDVAIWKDKCRIDNPLLCEEDGPVYQLRRWYEQFYVDVEDVTADMTNRFEFEMDLSRPVRAWEAEVAANIANGTEIFVG